MTSPPKYVRVKGRRLHLYDTYNSSLKAHQTAKYMQKKHKNNYFIFPYETTFTGRVKYALYMNKIYNLASGLF